jgi:hypothetical protein
MLNLDRILKQDRLLRAMTGLSRKAFEEPLPIFAQAYESSRLQEQQQRQRAPGGARKATLRTMKAKLFYIWLYCKCYACEHAHAGIKRYNAASAVYRNRVTDFDDRLMLVAAGLWNFYLDAA